MLLHAVTCLQALQRSRQGPASLAFEKQVLAVEHYFHSDRLLAGWQDVPLLM